MAEHPNAWKLAVIAVIAIATLAVEIWRARAGADEVVLRCKGNESRIRNVFYWTSSWNLGFGVDTLAERYCLSKEDMKIVLDRQLYHLGETLMLSIVLFALASFVMIRL